MRIPTDAETLLAQYEWVSPDDTPSHAETIRIRNTERILRAGPPHGLATDTVGFVDQSLRKAKTLLAMVDLALEGKVTARYDTTKQNYVVTVARDTSDAPLPS